MSRRKVFHKKLQTIKQRVHEANIPGYTKLQISISIGGTICQNEKIEAAVARADHFMYQAKNNKNMVVMGSGENGLNQNGGDVRKQKILVVDDSEMNRAILSEILSEEYDIVEADSGESCIDKLRQYEREISLVLLDIVMPGMSGIELCRKIKENSRTSAIGVILLTAHNLQNYEVSGYRVGADAYVAKPFSLEVLFSRIDNLVARQNKIQKNILRITHKYEKQ